MNLIVMPLLFSCTGNANNSQYIIGKTNTTETNDYPDTLKGNSSYVSTGFYFLADAGQGIKMQKERSDEIYNISKIPFASVKNILRADAQKNIVQGHDTYNITMVFDNKGTKDLEQGTGNPSYPKIAVVIANRLFYVVENVSKISTGIMDVILVDYTEKEVNDLTNAINHKK